MSPKELQRVLDSDWSPAKLELLSAEELTNLMGNAGRTALKATAVLALMATEIERRILAACQKIEA
jgi:hypothetical protein